MTNENRYKKNLCQLRNRMHNTVTHTFSVRSDVEGWLWVDKGFVKTSHQLTRLVKSALEGGGWWCWGSSFVRCFSFDSNSPPHTTHSKGCVLLLLLLLSSKRKTEKERERKGEYSSCVVLNSLEAGERVLYLLSLRSLSRSSARKTEIVFHADGVVRWWWWSSSFVVVGPGWTRS